MRFRSSCPIVRRECMSEELQRPTSARAEPDLCQGKLVQPFFISPNGVT